MLFVKFGFCSGSYLQSCAFFSELELKNEILEEKRKNKQVEDKENIEGKSFCHVCIIKYLHPEGS